MRTVTTILALALLAGTASAYTLKQKSFRGSDGRVQFACVTKPFAGAIAFVPSTRFRSGTAAIVIPEGNYSAVQRRRYPTAWYAAAVIDLANGLYTPAVRQFERETGKAPTVMFQAEGDRYGNYDRPHLPLDDATLEAASMAIDGAVSNCRLRGR